MKVSWLLLPCVFLFAWGETRYYDFIVRSTPYARLCSTKKILTVNGQFPGPTIYANKGDIVVVKTYNRAQYNITLHWHGVKQPRNPWSDGPEYITQCPIPPGGRFEYTIILSNEEGTVWWHAHSDWTRATVHGAIVVHPQLGTIYPFTKPDHEVPIILGEWWKEDINEVLALGLITGADFNISDAFTINGQPGDRYPCSKQGTFRLRVEHGKSYLLRIVNAALNDELFLAVANHKLTVVGTDGAYTKPLQAQYIMITPGQTMDVLLEANQPPNLYYMAARAFSDGVGAPFDNTTATAIVEYSNYTLPHSTAPSPIYPHLPYYNNTLAAFNFSQRLRSLASGDHPIEVPLKVDTHLVYSISVNTFPCPQNSCGGPNGSRFAASINNISFETPQIDILDAYYAGIRGVFRKNFPSSPPYIFNFTADSFPMVLEIPKPGTKVKVLKYGECVELVFQGTNLVAGEDHPLHLHGFSFYVVGSGFGNYDPVKDPLEYNLVDPPFKNTVSVPRNGWVALRFIANNPGVWFMHCHLERHLSWGMDAVFIVRDGEAPDERLLPRPPNMPRC
ncbi:putative laccase-9 [Nymphaea thermarum]|nr:putative laccase-9 [Nymphaea thermarum]